MPKLCSRDFDVYVTVESPTDSADGFGGFSTSWATKTTIWCKYEERNGEVPLKNGKLTTETGVIFTTVYRDDVLTSDRLVLDGLVYDIKRVDNLNRKNEYLVIYCDSGVAT
jgi:SPP1 family predicted phage head-tail adaptor